jgi:hypothetical protein
MGELEEIAQRHLKKIREWFDQHVVPIAIYDELDKLETELARKTTLDEEAEFWIREKGISLTEKQKEKVIEELINRWDKLAEEEIEEIAKEVKGREKEKLKEVV